MSLSFHKLLMRMEQEHPDSEYQSITDSPLLDSGDSGEVLTAIRNGLHLRKKEECGNFWDDFISVCNNSSALAALLGVRSEQVSSWPNKIRKALEEVEEEENQDKKPELIHTGDVGEKDVVANPSGNVDMNQPGITKPY